MEHRLRPLSDRLVLSEAEGTTTQSLQVPELSQLLWQDIQVPFQYNKVWSEAKDDPWLIFHTSGTTGMCFIRYCL